LGDPCFIVIGLEPQPGDRQLLADSVEKVENIAATKFTQKRADRRIRLAMSLKASAKATG
jgi:hypothetical protein